MVRDSLMEETYNLERTLDTISICGPVSAIDSLQAAPV